MAVLYGYLSSVSINNLMKPQCRAREGKMQKEESNSAHNPSTTNNKGMMIGERERGREKTGIEMA